ncbi:MAG: hypothetical protein HYU66_24645, partial [Armatimonadetes bacterium]|nr:hypothetical protein [Armatimonadota bacterium]
VRPRPGTRAWAALMDPAIESDFDAGRYVYHEHSPPGKWTEYPGITVSDYGAGRVVYLPVPFVKAYASKRCPGLRQVFAGLLEQALGVAPRVRVAGPAALHSALTQDDEGWLLHLIYLQRETESMYLESRGWPGPMEVTVRAPWPVKAVEDCLTGERLDREGDSVVTFTIPGIREHRIYRLRRA